MIIVGAKGFAKEVLQVFYQRNELQNIVFFDNVNSDLPEKLYDRFEILKTDSNVKSYIKNVDDRFVLGVGNPKIREKLYMKFSRLSGKIETVISPKSDIGTFNTHIGQGVNIMTGSIIVNDVNISDGCLINLNCTIGHDSNIGKFTELSPGVHISGNCIIGEFCNFGTGAVVLPRIKIGNYVTVGAGAVVTKNINDGLTVVGIPAKPI